MNNAEYIHVIWTLVNICLIGNHTISSDSYTGKSAGMVNHRNLMIRFQLSYEEQSYRIWNLAQQCLRFTSLSFIQCFSFPLPVLSLRKLTL